MIDRNAELGPQTIAMYAPQRDRATNVDMTARLYKFYGPENVKKIYCDTANLKEPDAETRNSADAHFLGFLQSTYRLTETTPQGFFRQQQKTADQVVRKLAAMLPDLGTSLDPKVELGVADSRPSELLIQIAKPVSSDRSADPRFYTDPVLHSEFMRRMLLSEIAAVPAAMTENGRYGDQLNGLIRHVMTQLYVGPQGRTTKQIVYADHVKATNEMVGISSTRARLAEDHTLKRHSFDVRSTSVKQDDGIDVFNHFRLKEEWGTVVKALKYAFGKGKGQVIPEKYVTDHIGMLQVAMGGRGERDEMMATLKGILDTHSMGVIDNWEDPPDSSRGVEYKRQQFIFGDGSQSHEFDRFQAEFQVYTLKDWINSRIHVGEADPETGLPTGPAHSLYKLDGNRPVFSLLFPKDLYHVDVDREVSKQIIKESRILSEIGTIESDALNITDLLASDLLAA